MASTTYSLLDLELHKLISGQLRQDLLILDVYWRNITYRRGGLHFSSRFPAKWLKLDLSALKVSVATSGLSYRHLYEIPFFPSKQSLRIVSALLAKPYVTVHHGFDTKLLPGQNEEN